jgi:hypothetical protein
MPRPKPAHVLTWHPDQGGFQLRHDHDDDCDARHGWWGEEASDAEQARIREHAQWIVLGWFADPDGAGATAFTGPDARSSWEDVDWDDFGMSTAEVWASEGDTSWHIDGEDYAYDGSAFYRITAWCTLAGLGYTLSIPESIEGAELPPGPIDVAAVTGWECEDGYVIVTRLDPLPGPDLDGLDEVIAAAVRVAYEQRVSDSWPDTAAGYVLDLLRERGVIPAEPS